MYSFQTAVKGNKKGANRTKAMLIRFVFTSVATENKYALGVMIMLAIRRRVLKMSLLGRSMSQSKRSFKILANEGAQAWRASIRGN